MGFEIGDQGLTGFTSPRCVLSWSVQSGSPGVHAPSPRHWKISLSSPTSPTIARRRLRGVWNWSCG